MSVEAMLISLSRATEMVLLQDAIQHQICLHHCFFVLVCVFDCFCLAPVSKWGLNLPLDLLRSILALHSEGLILAESQ